jgi:phage-related protein
MAQLWNDKKIHSLIFDEEPYKVYSAKVTGMITIKHICFEQEKNASLERVYRGEGSITFSCYFPFARSRF